MSVEDLKLIDEVRKRPGLWDAQQQIFQSRQARKLLWNEVAGIMGKSRDDVQKKFKNMKDIYRREVRKFNSKSDDKNNPKWRLYEDMEFLKDNLAIRKRRKRIAKPESNDDETMDSEELSDSSHNPITSVSINNAIYTPKFAENTSGSTIEYKRNPSPVLNTAARWQQFQKIDVDRLAQLLEENSQIRRDDDYNFLYSFHPYMKKMPELVKLQFRVRMQELLYNTMAEIEAANSLSNSLQVQISYETPIDICDNK